MRWRERKKKTSPRCVSVWGVCAVLTQRLPAFFSSREARTAGRKHCPPPSRADALHWLYRDAITSNRHYANFIFCRGVLGSLQRPALKTLLLMHRLHGRALFYLPHLLVECSCGSGELEICSGQKWAAQMYLMRLELTTRRLNYREIKVLISPKWATKKKTPGPIATSLRSAQIFLLSSAQCSGINTLALTVCAAWAAPVGSSVENITKTLIIPSETGNWISSSFLCSFLHGSMVHPVGAPSPRRIWTGWQFPWMRLSISHC